MLPREGLLNIAFSVFAEIRHRSINSKKLTDINSIKPAWSKRLTERKEAVYGTMSQATFTIQKRSCNSGILSILEATWTA